MNELETSTRTSATSTNAILPAPLVSFTFAAAIVTAPLQYPHRIEQYEILQEKSSYSNYMETDARITHAEYFWQQVAAIYNSFAQRQERLGPEFEAAIFSDLEGLYEA